LTKRNLSSEFMNERAKVDVKGENVVGREMVFGVVC
jgi:hypothetical protein